MAIYAAVDENPTMKAPEEAELSYNHQCDIYSMSILYRLIT